jgi:hypothetical protein
MPIFLKKLKILFLLFLAVQMCSCIEIVEEITVNKDKSGTIGFSLNLGSLGGLALSMGENYIDANTISKLKEFPGEGALLLKGMDGIANIIPVSNKNGMFSLSFDFDKSKNLNKALYKLFNKKKSIIEPGYISVKKHKLIKKNLGPVIRLFTKKYVDKLKDKTVLKLIKYKTIYHLPSPARKESNSLSKEESDKKTVEFSCTVEELLNSPVDIGNRIKY